MKLARRTIKRPSTQLVHSAPRPFTANRRALELELVEDSLEGRSVARPNEDHALLDKARLDWQLGDWSALVQLDDQRLPEQTDRARLALLVAGAYQHLGYLADAGRLAGSALRWGCSRSLVARVLLAGVHNGGALAAAAANDHSTSAQHFNTASVVAGESQPSALCDARRVRELARVGLLAEAARLLERQVEAVSTSKHAEAPTADRLMILETELELLRGELSLAQQRGQLSRVPQAVAPLGQTDHDWRQDLQKRSTSQLGQDLWVLEQTSYKRGGYFVEFGATDGVLLSNSYLLEVEFGWTGICAEPNPKLFEQLKQNRRCLLSDACIGGHSGVVVDFVLADAYGGIVDYAGDDSHAPKREAYRRQGAMKKMTTVSLNDFLTSHRAPRYIDYLSIDTEGSEFDILKSFPFDRWTIQMLTVEHNFTERRADIRALLESKGYHCIEQRWDDWYQLKEVR